MSLHSNNNFILYSIKNKKKKTLTFQIEITYFPKRFYLLSINKFNYFPKKTKGVFINIKKFTYFPKDLLIFQKINLLSKKLTNLPKSLVIFQKIVLLSKKFTYFTKGLLTFQKINLISKRFTDFPKSVLTFQEKKCPYITINNLFSYITLKIRNQNVKENSIIK